LLSRGVSAANFEQWAISDLAADRTTGPFVQGDPITASCLEETTTLIDGYHRASWFWQTADDVSKIAVFVPA
jgi:hypothetical protein